MCNNLYVVSVQFFFKGGWVGGGLMLFTCRLEFNDIVRLGSAVGFHAARFRSKVVVNYESIN